MEVGGEGEREERERGREERGGERMKEEPAERG
jgi:hypothetical protein